jgi:hypothetical protein
LSFAWNEASSFAKEVFFLMAVWTQQLDVIWTTVTGVLIAVVYLENLWDAVVTAPLTDVWSKRKNLPALHVRCDRYLGKRALLARDPVTLTAAIDDAGFRNVVRVAVKLLTANDAQLRLSRSPFRSLCCCHESWSKILLGAFPATESIVTMLINLFLLATLSACDRLQWLTLVMTDKETSMGSIASQLSSATARAFLCKIGRSVVVRKIVIFQRMFCGKRKAAPAGTNLVGHLSVSYSLSRCPLAGLMETLGRAVNICSVRPMIEGGAAESATAGSFGQNLRLAHARARAEAIRAVATLRKLFAAEFTAAVRSGLAVWVSRFFGGDHRVFPTWRVVVWNVFGHAIDLLCGPFRKRLTVSWA